VNLAFFIKEIRIVGKELGLEPLVIEGEELNRQGFGGLYNVGKAAINPPKLVVLSNIKPESKRTIAWVGKGIVYDTGGLSIKSKANMCTMKQDCGGAAAVLGAFYTAVSLVKKHVYWPLGSKISPLTQR
jgi:probable aminopeptidase NPEPL1